MAKIFNKKQNELTGWIVLAIIVLLIISTIFAGRFFKSEEKIKLAFENEKLLSVFVAAHNSESKIKGAFVLFYKPGNNRCAVVSILPKTYMAFGELGYLTLENALDKKVGNDVILSSVSSLLGKKIDYYVLVNKQNVINLVDVFGGSEIVSKGVKKPELQVSIPVGVTLLDGDKAVEYLSYIDGDDLNAAYRQLKRMQMFITGLLKLRMDFLEQFNERVVSSLIYKMIETNMSVNELIIVYNEIKNNCDNGIFDYSRDLKNIILYCDKKNVPGYDFVYLPKNSGEWIKTEVVDVVADLGKMINTKVADDIVIEILNGTDIVGLAARARTYLNSYGFDILNIGNAEEDNYENTMIIGYGEENKARKLADLIRCKHIIAEEKEEGQKIDLTLILGRDFDGRLVR